MQSLLNTKIHLTLVILVDSNDNPIGTMAKMEAHEKGALHRAFSVLIFNSSGELLLQRRATTKYHSGGLWTNTCCSHPAPGEDTADAAVKRLEEEMGIRVKINYHSCFVYRTELDHGLQEHEFDHIYIGYSDQQPVLNPDEVVEYKHLAPESVSEDIRKNPQAYSVWFKIVCQKLFDTSLL